MAIALVQTKGGGAATGNIALTWTSNTTTGNFIVVFVTIVNGTVSSITDSQSNTYTALDANFVYSGTDAMSCYYAKNIAGGTTPTITVNTSATSGNAAIAREYSGLDTSAPADKTTHASGSNSFPNSGATAATTQASELVVAWTGNSLNTTNTVGTGYGNFLAQTQGNSQIAIEDKTVSSTGAQTGAFGTSNFFAWGCGVATFKAAGAAPAFIARSIRPVLQAVNRASSY